jgi:hypothetical protein
MRILDEVHFMTEALTRAATLGAVVEGKYPEDARISGRLVRRLDFDFADGVFRSGTGKARRKVTTPAKAAELLIERAREKNEAQAREQAHEANRIMASEITRGVRHTYCRYDEADGGFELILRGLDLETVGKAARALYETLGEEPDAGEAWRKSPLFKVQKSTEPPVE